MTTMSSQDDELRALHAGPLVLAAAGFLGVAGLFTALGALQLVITIRFFGELEWAQQVVRAIGVVGIVTIVLAARVIRMRLATTITATVVAWVSAPALTAWLVFCASQTIISIMQMASVGATWIAALLLPFAIASAKRASDMRKRLGDAGLDVGL